MTQRVDKINSLQKTRDRLTLRLTKNIMEFKRLCKRRLELHDAIDSGFNDSEMALVLGSIEVDINNMTETIKEQMDQKDSISVMIRELTVEAIDAGEL